MCLWTSRREKIALFGTSEHIYSLELLRMSVNLELLKYIGIDISQRKNTSNELLPTFGYNGYDLPYRGFCDRFVGLYI